MPLFPLVHFDDIFRVDRQTFVGIDNDTEQARISLNKKHKLLIF